MGRPSLDQSRQPDQWIQGIEAGTPTLEQVKDLSPADLLGDALVFGLRLNAGVDPAALATRFATPLPARVAGLFQDLITEGLMETSGDGVRLTGEGRMRADAVGVAILERFD